MSRSDEGRDLSWVIWREAFTEPLHRIASTSQENVPILDGWLMSQQ